MAINKQPEVKFIDLDITLKELQDAMSIAKKDQIIVVRPKGTKDVYILSGKITKFDPKKVLK